MERSVSIDKDEEHLKLLSVFHYVAGGIAGFFACFPIMHLVMGIVVLVAALAGKGEGPPVFVGLFFVMIALIMITMGWALAVCLIISGRQLARQKHYTFCFIVACVSCAFMPFGTVLGVFTIIVLMRPSVKELFAAKKSAALRG